ncbi:hypothetical protein DAT35_15055 [Vitiosangium sp. GDMCC 1.1324]|nr:hypothetical protein DAT35_15055 [Vitiosangium sp. GDMCC 1.1324]
MAAGGGRGHLGGDARPARRAAAAGGAGGPGGHGDVEAGGALRAGAGDGGAGGGQPLRRALPGTGRARPAHGGGARRGAGVVGPGAAPVRRVLRAAVGLSLSSGGASRAPGAR